MSAPADSAARRLRFWPLRAAAILLPLVAFAAAAHWSWRLVDREARAQVERNAAALREHVLRAFETQDALLVAIQQATAGMGWEEIARSDAVARFLRELDAATPGAGAVGMISPEGIGVQFSVTAFPPEPVSFADRDYVRAQRDPATAGRFVGEAIVARVNGLLVFPYGRPRLGPDGRPDGGTIWATFRADAFAPFFATLLQGPGDVVGVARADGSILLRHPPAPGAAVAPRLPPGSPQARAIAAVMEGPPGHVARFDEARSPVDGRRRFYATLRVGDLPVAVTYGMDPAGLRGAWLRQVAGLAAVALAAAALLLALVQLAQGHARREAAALARARDAADARARAEARLREGQRAALLGQLAAGVAHDVRNLIQGVEAGNALLRARLEQGRTPEALRVLDGLSEALGRGRALTRRLLGLAPHAAAEEPAALDPAACVAGAVELIRHALGRAWPVTLAVAPGVPALVRGTAAELEAALLNFALNARDAMPGGGTLRVTLDAAPPPADAALPAGRFARIALRDEGCGMDATTLARVGEAFFTTKPAGQGTGLGLATALAFAQAAGGALRLDSAGPGQGCTVALWLPAFSHHTNGSNS